MDKKEYAIGERFEFGLLGKIEVIEVTGESCYPTCSLCCMHSMCANLYNYVPRKSNPTFLSESTMTKCCKVLPETVGQFTGFREVDGTEIYEGDIFGVGEKEYKLFNRMVVFIKDGFYLSDNQGYGDRLDCEISINTGHVGVAEFMRCHGKEYVVIGNIHDNPELL
jgi:uncharacterized phage protein (TIGR01671 family)